MSQVPPPSQRWKALGLFDRGTLICFAIGALLIATICWGGLQASDPLEAYIRVDKFRHIAGFGTLGLCAAFAPTIFTRVGFITGSVLFAAALEVLQGLLTASREPSLKDFVASSVGVFAGYGMGSSGLSALEIARSYRDRWFNRSAL